MSVKFAQQIRIIYYIVPVWELQGWVLNPMYDYLRKGEEGIFLIPIQY